MDSLKGLFGGEGNGDDDKEILPGESKARARDFVSRYMTGDPAEGYDADEARDQFRRVMKTASPEQIQRATRQAVDNLPEDKRADFARMLQQRQAGQGMVDIQRTGETGAAQPGAQGGTPDLGGLLGGLLGGGAAGGAMGGLDDILGGFMGGDKGDKPGATEGGAGMDGMLGGLGDLINSPMGKVILGGVAAFAMKEMIDKD